MKAMVLAAGRGERLRPLTDTLPKPLVAVGGRPLIVWQLERLARAGVREVVINLSWLGAQLRAALGSGAAFGLTLHYSEEGPVPLETGGGIVHALPLLGPQPFLVVSADVWSEIDYAKLRLARGALAQLLLVPNPPHHPRGDFALAGELVTEDGAERFTYANVGLYTPEFFAGCPAGRFPLIEPLRRAIAARRVHGQLYRGPWHDVGTRERLEALNASLARVR